MLEDIRKKRVKLADIKDVKDIYSEEDLRLFFNLLEKTDNGCWEWTGAVRNEKDRYGIFYFKKSKISIGTHRFSWIYHNNVIIPTQVFVCHKCDNKICSNPDHLFIGSCRENILDAKKKGLLAMGEKAGMAKLTDKSVREIKLAWNNGSGTQSSLARKYNVKQSNIWLIVNGKAWEHIVV